MIKIEWWVETPSTVDYDEIEVEENCSDEEIEEMVKNEVFNLISWGWNRGTNDWNSK